MQKKKKMKKILAADLRRAGAVFLAAAAAFTGNPQVSYAFSIKEKTAAAANKIPGENEPVSSIPNLSTGTGVSAATGSAAGNIKQSDDPSDGSEKEGRKYGKNEKSGPDLSKGAVIKKVIPGSEGTTVKSSLKGSSKNDSFSIDGITGKDHIITMKKNDTSGIPIFCLSPGKRARTGWSLSKDSSSKEGLSVDSEKIKEYIKNGDLGKNAVIAILGRAVSDGKIDEDDDYLVLRDTLRDIWKNGTTKFKALNERHNNIMTRALDPYITFTESKETKTTPAKPEKSTTKNAGHYSFYPAEQTWKYSKTADQGFKIQSAVKFSPSDKKNYGTKGEYSGYMHFGFSNNETDGSDVTGSLRGHDLKLGSRVTGVKGSNSNVYVVMGTAVEKVVIQPAEPAKTTVTNTGNFSSRSAGSFTGSGKEPYKIHTVTAVEKGWYTILKHNSDDSNQIFMRLGAKSKPVDKIPFKYCGYARQKIILRKNISGASYDITADNIWNSDDDSGAELINMRYEDAEGAAHEGNEDIADLPKVKIKGKDLTVKDLKTNDSGQITVALTWKYSARRTYRSDLSQSDINKKKKAAKQDVADWMRGMKITYKVKETDSGDPDFAIVPGDQTFTLGKENTYFKKNPDSADSWNDNEPEKINGSDETDNAKIAEIAYNLNNTDEHKFKSLSIVKEPDESVKDQGNAPSLAGARFGLYSDETCTSVMEEKETSGNSESASLTFDTKIYSGNTYYVKEIKAPYGYKLNNEVKKISWKDSSTTSSQIDFGQQSETIKETLKTGHFNILKTMTSDSERPENGAEFIVKNSKGETAGDRLITDSEGITAFTDELTEGVYSVTQVRSGNNDTDDVMLKETRYVLLYDDGVSDDLIVLKCSSDGSSVYSAGYHGEADPEITDKEKYSDNSITTYRFEKEDSDKESQYGLKLSKTDATYGTESRRSGHTFRLYRIDTQDNESADEYPETFTFEKADGRSVTHRIKPVMNDSGTYLFTTDESGVVMFSSSEEKRIRQGRYLIREVKPAKGYYITTDYIEVNLRGFRTDDYDAVMYDAEGKKTADGNIRQSEIRDNDGNDITVECIEADYPNEEKYGKFTILKYGEVLAGFNSGKEKDKKKGFEYKYVSIPGTSFTVSAKEDIYAQDGSDHILAEKGECVLKVTTGKNEPDEIITTHDGDAAKLISCEADPDDSSVTVTLPLGKYVVEETKAPYGFLRPAQNRWELEFDDGNAEETYRDPVVLPLENTDKDGRLTVKDDCAKAEISVVKSDSIDAARPVSGCAFGIYTADDIYNHDGKKIADRDQLLDTIITGSDGRAVSELELPVMTGDHGMGNSMSNSGDYYFKEIQTSGSYYLNASRAAVHVEYKDDRTAVIKASAKYSNTPTEIFIRKLRSDAEPATPDSVTASEDINDRGDKKNGNADFLDGCHLILTDSHGNDIASWITGDGQSVELSPAAEKLGYVNLRQEYKENMLHITGLLRGETYILTEIRPADGWTTQDPLVFTVPDKENEKEHPVISWKGAEITSSDNIISMYDLPVRYEFSKKSITGEDELPGCMLSVVTTEGAVVDSWISGSSPHMITGDLIAGNTYYLREDRPADGYVTAETIGFTVRDDRNIQKTEMKDDMTRVSFYKTDITGEKEVEGAELSVISSGGAVVDRWISGKEPHASECKLTAGEEYTLRETRPADGYVTASDVTFKVMDTGEIQKVFMKDDTTKIRFFKYAAGTEKVLEGASYELKDEDGNIVMKFETSEKGTDFNGVLKAGEKYVFHEVKAPKGYKLADDVAFTVKDTGDVQTVKAYDKKNDKIKKTEKKKSVGKSIKKLKPEEHKKAVKGVSRAVGVPRTGYGAVLLIFAVLMLISGAGCIIIFIRRKNLHIF